MRKLVHALALTAPVLLFGCSPPSPIDDTPSLVILGFDGLERRLTEQWMRSGRLPNLAALAQSGGSYPLETAPSADGASAWASFATGVNPGKHNVYGAFDRHPADYAPALTLIGREPARLLFDYIPLAGPSFTSRRGGTSFWVLAGRAGIRSSVLTVPMTFPPEEVPNGELLSGMPLPDLLETPGAFHYFATDLPPEAANQPSIGVRQRLAFQRNVAAAALRGPRDPLATEGDAGRLTLPFTITWNHEARSANLDIGDHVVHLNEREWSRWIDLDFRANPLVRVRGMTRMYLITAGQALRLYVAPIHWHPAAPLAPISSPATFAAELFERLGPFRTLGWPDAAEALNQGLIDEAVFLDDVDRAFTDRAETILSRIDAGQWDLLVGGVDVIDHLQHLLWRLIDPQHPMHDVELARRHGRSILRLYQRADALVGDVRARVGPATTIMVVSAHGFQPFRRAVNLNAWLTQHGYMTLENQEIDWTRTRVYVSGVGQLSINRAGREPGGIVPSGAESDALLEKLSEDLLKLRDPETGVLVVRHVYRRDDVYAGPHAENAADLQVGFARGYRAAFTAPPSAPHVIAPNLTRWSGDHGSVDYPLVPGLLITNRRVATAAPRVIDIAPTVLQWFGVDVPAEIDGRPILEPAPTPPQ